MYAIFKREFKSYFHSVIGWLFLAAFTFFASLFFIINNVFSGSPHVYYTIKGMITVLLFIAPVLTMRVIAEEKRQKLDQLLLTSPVGPFKIVMGKYLALLAILAISCITICIYPLILIMYGTIPITETYVSILGFFLFGATVLAVGMFVSSVTEKQVVAIILSYAVFLGMMFLPSFFSILMQKENWFLTIVKKLDISEPAYQFFSGTLDLSAVLYYISAIALFLLLTYRSIGKQTFSVASRGMRKVLFSVLGTVLSVAFIIGANIGFSFIPKQFTQFDITDTKIYSLTETSKEMLSKLDKDITIYCLADPGNMDGIVKQYLETYEEASDKIKVEYVSYAQNPNFYSTYTDTAPEEGSLIVVSGDKNMLIDYYDCYVHQSGIDYNTYQTYDEMVAIDVEGRITAAISALNAEEFPLVYVVEGHDEAAITDYALSALKTSGYDVYTVNLMNIEAIPEDVDLVIINAPMYDLSKEAVNMLRTYINNGGNGIFVLGAPQIETPNYDGFIEEYGISIAEGLILEGDANYVYQNLAYAILPNINYHSITSNINTRVCFCALTKGIKMPEEYTNDTVYSTLLSTSESAFCKTDLSNNDMTPAENDILGPFALAAYLQVPQQNGKESGLVILAPNQFLLQDVDESVSHANADLFLSAAKEASKTELASAVAAKSLTYDNITVSLTTTIIFAVLFVAVIPIVFVCCGIVIFIIRRKK